MILYNNNFFYFPGERRSVYELLMMKMKVMIVKMRTLKTEVSQIAEKH